MTEEGDNADGRWVRVGLAAGCVLAVVLATLLVPVLGSGGIAGTPIDSVLPGERFDDGSAAGAGGTGGGFGALNPGDRTGVGGDTGFDSETFGANDTEVHFTVESPEPAYWRTGSYDTYTGTGWERDGATEPFEEPVEPVGLTDGELAFELTLEEPATAVPTVWQPRQISGVESPEITDDGAVRTDELLEAGTTVSGVSQRQADDVDVLRAAGEEYPDGVVDRYTQLPADTPDRLEEFSEELTADDETPYDAAMTVQNWLRSEKNYSLEADRRSEQMADTFVFEMEAGYCEYFATAMTAMLRTQEIPARYTIGYSTGQPVGEDTYEVRGMNAHAWVEVYFPEVGWVAFDPTPGSSRLESQSQVLEDELNEEFDLQEPGSPGETFEAGETEDDPDEGEEIEAEDDWYDIDLNQTAVPGLPVEIQVTEDGEPAPDVVVTVNDEPVGVTGADGTVTVTVPDDDELRIAVRPVDEEDRPRTDVPTDLGDRLYSPLPAAESDETGEDNETTTGGITAGGDEEPILRNITLVQQEANTTVDVQREATLSVAGDVVPGERVTVTATVRDVAVPDATVSLDGEPVGTTDEDGRVGVRLPEEAGNASLAVERGPVTGEETVTVPGLELSVSTGLLALPFSTATVDVTAGERGVADAPVSVDGERVGTTGADGSVEVRLPLSPSATVEATSGDTAARETVDGLVVTLLAVAAGVGLLVGAPVALVWRRNPSIAELRRGFSAALDRLVGATQLALLGAVRAVTALPGRLQALAGHVVDVLRGRRSPAVRWRGVLAWLAATGERLRRWPADEQDPEPAVAGGIRRAWSEFLSRVSVDDPAAQTPDELASHAVEADGMPAEPVEALLASFRAVEYGSRPEREHLDRAEQALARLDRATADGNRREPRPADRLSADGGENREPQTGADRNGGTE